MEVLIGIDIGGSHAGVCCLSLSGEALGVEERCLTSRDAPAVVSLVFELIESLLVSVRKKRGVTGIRSIGIGCPGQPKDGVVVAASNFPSWKNVPLVALVQERYPAAFVTLLKDSDAALAGELWGEYRETYGPVRTAVMITLGTGIGVSLLLNGEFYSGSSGLVEGGHMIVNSSPTARKCGCGQRGCAEVYASASNVVQLYKEGSGDDRDIGAAVVFAVAEGLDEDAITAKETIAEAADVLAVLCINVCRMIDPEVIIFAGGMSRAGEDLLSKVRRNISARAWTCLPQRVPLVVASSDHAGPVGAALFAAKLATKNNVPCPPNISNKPSNDSRAFNGKVCVSAGILSIAIWTARAKPRCPMLGGVVMFGLPSVALYAGFLYFFSHR